MDRIFHSVGGEIGRGPSGKDLVLGPVALSLTRFRAERRLVSVLGRELPLQALRHLVAAIQQTSPEVELGKIAIFLDANVLLNLASHARGIEVADYLAGQHKAPLI